LIRTILKYPHPALAATCERVTVFDDSLKQLAADLLDTLRGSKRQGAALSASQIGDLRRVFVVDLPGRMPHSVFVNPDIHKRRGEVIAVEGCLSLGLADDCKVRRAKIINWSAQTLSGRHISGKLHDFEARVFQHELDHLNGVLIVSRKVR